MSYGPQSETCIFGNISSLRPVTIFAEAISRLRGLISIVDYFEILKEDEVRVERTHTFLMGLNPAVQRKNTCSSCGKERVLLTLTTTGDITSASKLMDEV